MWSRREFLLGAAALGVSPLLFSRTARATQQSPGGRPRKLIQIFPRGGIDAVLTTDPKIRSQVSPKVDVPYGEEAIFTVGNSRFGPLFKQLESLLPDVCVINGVAGSTVAHQTGEIQVQQARRSYPPTAVGLSGTLGALLRGNAPLADYRVYANMPPYWTPPTGRSLICEQLNTPSTEWPLARLHALANDGPRSSAAARVLSEELRRCGSGAACDPYAFTSELLGRFAGTTLPTAPKLKISEQGKRQGSADKAAQSFADVIRDTIFLLQHDLASCVFIQPPFSFWDSHVDNLAGQSGCIDVFAPALVRLVQELRGTRTTDGRTLAEQTGIVVMSEIGRFPIINEMKGKDHFPELPVLLMGPGIKPGQYGATDANMVSTPISFQTGRPSSSPKDAVPTLDDIGTTVLNWFGIEDAASYGYLGRRLDCALA